MTTSRCSNQTIARLLQSGGYVKLYPMRGLRIDRTGDRRDAMSFSTRTAPGLHLWRYGHEETVWSREVRQAVRGRRVSRAHWGERGLPVFVQVIQGQVKDAAKAREAIDQWERELAPGADGWLGSTGGVTDDGKFIELVRFESADAARRNSSRPEQDRWWQRTSKLFTGGGASFKESDNVAVDVVGDPERAGFVQVIQGQGSDPDRARELMEQDADKWAAFRPDIVASVAAQHEDGGYTMAMYFTSEAAAREGERKEPPPELKEQMAEMDALTVGEPEFFDIKKPWMHAPH